jgi:hypothetical protein
LLHCWRVVVGAATGSAVFMIQGVRPPMKSTAKLSCGASATPQDIRLGEQ